MNPSSYQMALLAESAPRNRAQRRAVKQNRARAERSQRRSRARIERALSTFQKESS